MRVQLAGDGAWKENRAPAPSGLKAPVDLSSEVMAKSGIGGAPSHGSDSTRPTRPAGGDVAPHHCWRASSVLPEPSVLRAGVPFVVTELSRTPSDPFTLRSPSPPLPDTVLKRIVARELSFWIPALALPVMELPRTRGAPPASNQMPRSGPAVIVQPEIVGVPPSTRIPEPRFFWIVTDCRTGAPPLTTTPPSPKYPPPSTTALVIRVPGSACALT